MRDVRTREDRATQPMDAGWLSFAIKKVLTHIITASAIQPGVKEFSPQNYLGDHQNISHP